MKKFVVTIIFAVACYVLPLAFVPQLIQDPRVVLLIVACAIMLMTQPAFSFGDATAQRKADRYSVLLIFAAGLISQVLPVVEWAYLHSESAVDGSSVPAAAGATLIAGGLAFRIWSIRTLGRFFTTTVQRVDGQRVIRTGPYSIVRHPSYLGAYLAMLGAPVLLGSWYSLPVVALLLALTYRHRIAAEETLLLAEFGGEYRDYMNTTPALIPGLYPTAPFMSERGADE